MQSANDGSESFATNLFNLSQSMISLTTNSRDIVISGGIKLIPYALIILWIISIIILQALLLTSPFGQGSITVLICFFVSFNGYFTSRVFLFYKSTDW